MQTLLHGSLDRVKSQELLVGACDGSRNLQSVNISYMTHQQKHSQSDLSLVFVDESEEDFE